MPVQQSEAGHEHILGELQIERPEVEQVSHEATVDHRRFMALHYIVMGAAVVTTAVNLYEGDGLRSFTMPVLLVALSMYGLMTQTTSRRGRIAGILQSQPLGSAINYQLGPSGMEIQSASASTRVSWRECIAFEESAHAFFLYTGRVIPEVLYKRAFREDEVTVVRERLAANVKRKATWRGIALAFGMGLAVLVLGIVLAVVVSRVGHAHH